MKRVCSDPDCHRGGEPTEQWYGVMLEDGSGGALCEECYKRESAQYKEWLNSLSRTQKQEYLQKIFGLAGIK